MKNEPPLRRIIPAGFALVVYALASVGLLSYDVGIATIALIGVFVAVFY